jgi:hypothetical protein
MPNRPASPNSAPRSKKLLGTTTPRLWTPPLRPLNRNTSRGYSVCDFAAMVGEPLQPWQRWAAIHAMETVPGGGYRFGTVLILVARQNGKSHLKRMVSLWRLYIDGARLVLGVAQDVSLAREQWQMAIDTIHGSPDLAAELEQVRRVNGDEWFKLDGGGRYKISASNRKAGRGLSIDELNIDELREQRTWDAWGALSKTTLARADSQIWAMSNAGDDESIVLNQLRGRALANPRGRIGIFEWSGPDGCELDDTSAWCAANPSLGRPHGVTEAGLRLAKDTDPPKVFRTEVLCQQVDQLDGAIDLTAWKACADPSGTMDTYRKRLAACFDVAPDGQHATLAVAALTDDSRPRVEIVKAWRTSDEARADLPALLDKLKPQVLGWYPTGPAGALAPILRVRPGSIELTGMRVAEICQGLADLVRGRRVIHADQDLLNAHVQYASKLPSGDGWRFTRKGGGETGHVDAAYAAAGAADLALTMPPPRTARIRIVG